MQNLENFEKKLNEQEKALLSLKQEFLSFSEIITCTFLLQKRQEKISNRAKWWLLITFDHIKRYPEGKKSGDEIFWNVEIGDVFKKAFPDWSSDSTWQKNLYDLKLNDDTLEEIRLGFRSDDKGKFVIESREKGDELVIKIVKN